MKTKYCDECGRVVELTKDGFCVHCGKHENDMISKENEVEKGVVVKSGLNLDEDFTVL